MPQIDANSPDRKRLADHARQVHPLSWKLLIGFLILGLACGGLYAYAHFTKPAPRSVASTPAGASGLLGARDTTEEPSTSTTDSWAGWTGAKGSTLGFGFVGGFVVGFIFRAFLKLMTLVTVVIVGGLMALSHYHILNIDLTHAQDVVQSNAEWLTDQATRLKDVVIAHLPSSTGGAAGAFFGLRRR
ncbi:MAG: hypothetical protein JWM57_3797 [Phycisphaerales bacterium]|nr:hypothetical protein [Phycisphaerales bacterium]